MVSFIVILEGISEFCLPKEDNCSAWVKRPDLVASSQELYTFRPGTPDLGSSCLFSGRKVDQSGESLIPFTGVLRTVHGQQALEPTLCLTTAGWRETTFKPAIIKMKTILFQ